jgi:putative transposase
MQRRIFDAEGHAQFVTFSCYLRRRLLDLPALRDEFVALTAAALVRHAGVCCGFVVMPNHVHVIVWFPETGRLSPFMKSWKQTTSLVLKRRLRGAAPHYLEQFPASDPFWQARYYAFSLFTAKKTEEKLDYMHLNPVRAALVERPEDWRWSSARHYLQGASVGIPVRWLFDGS